MPNIKERAPLRESLRALRWAGVLLPAIPCAASACNAVGGEGYGSGCRFYVAAPGGTEIQPGEHAAPLAPGEPSRFEWGDHVDIDPADAAQRRSGVWVKLSRGYAAVYKPNRWVRSADLVSADELERVTACWPIRSLTLEQGQYRFNAWFRRDGRFSYTLPGERAGSGHVYYMDTVVELRAKDGRPLVDAVLDVTSGELKNAGAAIRRQSRSDGDPAGRCVKGPVTVKSGLAQPPSGGCRGQACGVTAGGR